MTEIRNQCLHWLRCSISLAAVFLVSVACLISQPSQGQELAKYTPIPNVNPDSSYIRLFGSYSETATFEIRSFGNKTGREYTIKPITMTVPSLASNQMSFSALNERSIGQGAGSLIPTGEDTAVTLYVKSSLSTTTGMFQHVRYTPATGAFDNVSVCTYKRSSEYSDINRFVFNAHTSRLVGYASIIGITNPDQVSRVVSLFAYDSNTGLGLDNFRGYQVTVPANTTMRIPFVDIERASGATPAAAQYHANIQIYAGDALEFTAIASHEVVQLSNGTSTNMTQLCPIVQPVVATSGGGRNGNGFGGYDPCVLPVDDPTYYDTYVDGRLFQRGRVPIISEDRVGCAAGAVDFPGDKSTPGHMYPDDPDNAGQSYFDGAIGYEGDVDWDKLSLTAGGRYDIIMGPRNPDLGNLKLTLRDPSGAPIPGATASTNRSGTGVRFLYQATITGVYYVEASSLTAAEGAKPNNEGNAGVTGKYQVQVFKR